MLATEKTYICTIGGSQHLDIGAKDGKADVELALDLEGPLEVGGYGLKLHAEAPVARAVLP
jgi:hypothetical protein